MSKPDPTGARDWQSDEIKQLYIWFGLTANSLRPHLTTKEWATLCKWSAGFTKRQKGKVRHCDRPYPGEWPDDLTDSWEALK